MIRYAIGPTLKVIKDTKYYLRQQIGKRWYELISCYNGKEKIVSKFASPHAAEKYILENLDE
jgi:hypothetical protein